MQVLLNTCYSAAILLMLSLSFFLIYKPTRIFHISHAFSIIVAPYIVYTMQKFSIWLFLSLLFSIFISGCFGVLNEILFYRRLRNGKNSGLKMLILSLGIYIFFQNIISFFSGDEIKSLASSSLEGNHLFLGAYITNSQIITILSVSALFTFTLYVWYKTPYGRAIRAISENPELSQVIGIPKDKLILLAFALGSVYAGIAGILIGSDVGITPTMGFSLLLNGLVVMIISGTDSIFGLLAGACIMAVVQNLTSYYIDTRWVDAVTYLMLIIFLIFRPYGVSGIKIYKAEI